MNCHINGGHDEANNTRPLVPVSVLVCLIYKNIQTLCVFLPFLLLLSLVFGVVITLLRVIQQNYVYHYTYGLISSSRKGGGGGGTNQPTNLICQ